MIFTTVSQMFDHVTNQFSTKELYFYKKENDWIGLSGSDIRSTVKNLAFGKVVVICSYLIKEFNIFFNKAFLCSDVLLSFL